MSDIMDGLAMVRATFLSINMKPPSAILLESHEEGILFLSEIRQVGFWVPSGSDLGKPVEMADGSMWMEIQVMGIIVRWPANRIAMPDGSWSYA